MTSGITTFEHNVIYGSIGLPAVTAFANLLLLQQGSTGADVFVVRTSWLAPPCFTDMLRLWPVACHCVCLIQVDNVGYATSRAAIAVTTGSFGISGAALIAGRVDAGDDATFTGPTNITGAASWAGNILVREPSMCRLTACLRSCL